jgi:hypothetical protein
MTGRCPPRLVVGNGRGGRRCLPQDSCGTAGRRAVEGRNSETMTDELKWSGPSVTVECWLIRRSWPRAIPSTSTRPKSELAQLDVSASRAIRLSVGNWVNSPAPVVISLSQMDQPNTPNANAITLLVAVRRTGGRVVCLLRAVRGPGWPTRRAEGDG